METGTQESGPWVWYGGHPGVDFVNTRRNRGAAAGAERAEYLRCPDDLAEWLVLGRLADERPRVDEAALADAVELREAIDDGVRAAVAAEPFPAGAAAIINRWLAEEPEHAPRLEIVGGVAVLRDARAPRDGDVRAALRQIAVEAARLLGTDERARLRICPGPNCGGRFVDTSAAGRRRWCSMLVCGNRAKVAKHRGGSRGAEVDAGSGQIIG